MDSSPSLGNSICREGSPKKKKKRKKEKKKSKVAGYKTNIQKLVAFLCINNEILEKEYKNTIPFKIAPKGVPILVQWK